MFFGIKRVILFTFVVLAVAYLIRFVRFNRSFNQNDQVNRMEKSSETIQYGVSSGSEQSNKTYDVTGPKYLHVLSYQRSGSSVLGELLMTSPHVCYVYEPLDAVYTSMYGTMMGFNVPGDIFTQLSGELRTIPEEELKETASLMDHIYSCQFSKLPHRILMHKFLNCYNNGCKGFDDWTNHYATCCTTKYKSIFSHLDHCNRHINTFCGRRFGELQGHQQTCRQILHNDGKWTSNKKRIEKIIKTNHGDFSKEQTTKLVDNFVKYFACTSKYSDVVLACAEEFLDKRCSSFAVRAVKTVRAAADVAVRLAESYTTYRVIHLVRDPRGVTKSRIVQPWTQGQQDGDFPEKVAGAYCDIALYNKNIIDKLARDRQGTTMTLIFDDILKETGENINDIFRFMKEKPAIATLKWQKDLEFGRKNKAQLTPKAAKIEQQRMGQRSKNTKLSRNNEWIYFFKYHEVASINRNCEKFFKSFLYHWEGLTV